MYSPPDKEEDDFGFFKEAYDRGYESRKKDEPYKNPYKASGHERDSTFSDELHYYYYTGYYN